MNSVLDAVMNYLDNAKGMLLGLAIGDAVGTTVEFRERGSFPLVTDMVGGGPFELEKGQWTDDTSMALCLAASLIERSTFDPKDQIDRYLRWRNEGYMSSNGSCFDIGMTVQDALGRYISTGNPLSGSTSPLSAGNGSIMRLAPVVIAFHRNDTKLVEYAGESSKTTHGCKECVESCRLFSVLLKRAMEHDDKEAILLGHDYKSNSTKVRALGEADYLNKGYKEVTGSGYVIESLETALWCFKNSGSFKEAVLLATNIGNDADTTAAICGQISGAYYGVQSIPDEWLESLTMANEISNMADQLYGLFAS